MEAARQSISSDDIELARRFAGELNIHHEIHPSDFIYKFLVTNPVFKKRSHAIRYYFYDGYNSANILRDLMSEIGIEPDSKFNILEFASGYG